MTLVKGFLRSKRIMINRQWLLAAFFICILTSYFLFKLFYYLLHSFRIFTHFFGYEVLVELSPMESFFYSLFYGSIAAIVGVYFFIRLLLESSLDSRDKMKRFRIRNILTEQGFTVWNFLNAFSRLVVLFGFLYISLPLQFDFNFMEELWLVLILIPTVMFTNLWPMLLRAMGKKSYKWVLYSFFYVMAFSLIVAWTNYGWPLNLDSNFKSNRVEHVYNLREPNTESFQTIERYYMTPDIYIVWDSTGNERPLFFWDDIYNPFRIEDVSDLISREMSMWNDYSRSQITANLRIDKRVKLKYVNELKDALRRSYFPRIQYSTVPRNSSYPLVHPQIIYSGIPYFLNQYFSPELENFLDSVETLDLSKHLVILPKEYRISQVRSVNRFKMEVFSDKTLINGRLITNHDLREVVYRFIKKYSPNYAIIFEPDDEITYEKYIQHLDLIYAAVDKLRHEMSYDRYSQPFDFLRYQVEYQEIITKYPLNLVEWTPQEKRLMELIERTGRRARSGGQGAQGINN